MNESTTMWSDRYIIEEKLGAGGMGTVYRAVDRLTQNVVALKRMQWLIADDALAQRQKIALGREFQILASLRHPHIISVLDYGFDAQQTPYFTMTFLPDAQDLLQACSCSPVPQKTRYLINVLLALHYLHRRGVLHLDLKPGNILVSGGRLRVLDFGLSLTEPRAGAKVPRSGTLFYMSPEVLRGKTVGPATDLYAVGVLAYQVLTGQLPFTGAGSISKLLDEILNLQPDLSRLDGEPALRPIVGRLLEKDPTARYPDALDVIHALNATLSEGVLLETEEIREGFLQASTFVGREAELGQLTEALTRAIAGQGSAWLVGGESGVGKSRLLDELRIQALVRGALVLQGQGVAGGGGLPFQLWREPLRRLVLGAHLDDLAASALLPLVPDIARLLGRDVRPAPELRAQAGQQRLLRAIAQLASQRRTPILLILEDLQWTGESLIVLRQLNRLVARLPVLVVGSYRDDERPDLPGELSGMRVIKLERLSGAEMAELSASMLGQGGQRLDVLELLQRETEGNAFFLVEVVRALAERAGRLSAVGQMALPSQVFAGGVQAIVQRRLERVPMEARFLLALAATAGRQLDRRVLAQLAPEADLGRWLMACANAAVLEIRDGVWRFAHEKLREGVLSAFPPQERAVLHHQVAQAMEHVYADGPDQAATLTYQWRMAGEPEKERRYARIAGERALTQCSNDEALTYLTRALELTPAADLQGRYELLVGRERVLNRRGEREAQAADLAALAQLAHALSEPGKQARVALRRANYAEVIGDYAAAIAASQQAVNLARDAGDGVCEAEGYMQWGYVLWREGKYALAQQRLEHALALSAEGTQLRATILRNVGTAFYYQSDYARAKSYYERSLDLCRQLGDQPGEGASLNNLGLVTKELGDHARAKDYYEQALRISREQGDRRHEAQCLNNLGIIFKGLGDYAGARACYEQALQIRHEIGDRQGLGSTLINQGNVSKLLGHYAEAGAFYERSLRICREIGDRWNEGLALNNLSRIYDLMGDHGRAQAYNQRALPIVQAIGDRGLEAEARQIQGDILVGLGQFDQAAAVCRQVLALRRELGQAHLAMVPLCTLAHISLARAELSQAQAQVEEILEYLLRKALDALDEAMQIYQTCYRVLQAAQDPRARGVLAAVHALLHERAAQIADDDLRRAFLENVAEHREIKREYGRIFLKVSP